MILLNPKKHDRKYSDEKSREIMLKTLEFFEKKGLASIKEDDRKRVWYREYLDFIKENKIFATLLTPSRYSDDPDARWDTYRNCEFNEIIAFYGLGYWYTWQVSILGLGPIWMAGADGFMIIALRGFPDPAAAESPRSACWFRTSPFGVVPDAARTRSGRS